MKYSYCEKVSSMLHDQSAIFHCLTNLKVWANCFNPCENKQHVSRQPGAYKKFFDSSVHNRTRILVVDANKEVRDLLDTLFNQYGFIVDMANNGLEAFRKFNAGGFHIVLTSIYMPGMNGNILSKQIKRVSADTPVIAITASPGLADNYFNKVLAKPLDLDHLLETMQTLLTEKDQLPSLKGLRQLKTIISTRKRKQQP